MRSSVKFAPFVFGLISLAASGCGGSGGGGGNGSSMERAAVRVVHLSPDAPAVDVLVDNSVALAGATYPSASDYLGVDEGVRNVKVNAAGTSTTVIEADLELQAGIDYTVAAINTLSRIEPLVLVDQTHTNTGNAAIRVVHGAPSAPNVDVYATAPGADLNNATPVLSNVPFKTASSYLSVPPGEYQFRVTVAGTKTVAIDSGAVTLTVDTVYTAFARDAVGGGAPFGILLVVDGR